MRMAIITLTKQHTECSQEPALAQVGAGAPVVGYHGFRKGDMVVCSERGRPPITWKVVGVLGNTRKKRLARGQRRSRS